MVLKLIKKLGITCFLALMMMAALGQVAHASDPPWATGQSRAEDIEVKIVIFGPGDEVPAWFGHIAMVVEDNYLNYRRLYNYGMFSFDSAMLAKFAMGRLWFWVGQAPVMPTYEAYRREGRSVRVLTLNLPAKEREEIAKFLAWNVLPANRDYLYDHYYDNCSTRLRDLIDKAVGGQFRKATEHISDQTLRDHTRRHAQHSPPMDMLLMFMMNDSIDAPITQWDELFLPGELEKALKDFNYINDAGESVPLIAEEMVYAEDTLREPVPDEPPTRWPAALLLGVLVGGIGALLGWRYFKAGGNPKDKNIRGRRIVFGLYQALVGLILGLPGTALVVMWIFTDHTVTYHNENLFLANPFTLLIFVLGIALASGSARAQRWLSRLWPALGGLGLVLVLLKLIPAFGQHIGMSLSLILPILLGFAAIYATWGRKTVEIPT